jgi:hypothetical protein
VPVVYAKYSMTLVQKKVYQISCHGICRDTVLKESNFKEIQKLTSLNLFLVVMQIW